MAERPILLLIDGNNQRDRAYHAIRGLTGPDGTQVDSQRFAHLLARFRMEFGRQHLMAGNRRQGVAALLDAWTRNPVKLRYLGQAVAGIAGWTPKS